MTSTWQTNCLRKIKEQQRQLPTLHVCVIGEVSSGKTTLIDALFEQITPDSIPMTIEELVLDEQVFLNETAVAHADVILYCVPANKACLSKEQQQWLMKIGKKQKIIVVITCAIGTKSEMFQQMMMQLQLPLQDIITIMAKPFPIYEKIVLPIFGLDELLESLEEIMVEQRATLLSAQQVSFSKKTAMSRQYMQKALMQVYGHHLGDVVALDWRQLVTEQQEILAKSLFMFSNEQHVTRLLKMLEAILYEDQQLRKALATTNQPLEQLTGLSACIVANAVVVSACEVLSLSYKKEAMDLTLNSEELKSLLSVKIISRLKQGKQNPDIQQLMRQQHFILPNQEQVERQHPTIHIQKKTPDLLQRVKVQSAKVIQHSLDRFSNWIRKS